jgi:hypothetical protein
MFTSIPFHVHTEQMTFGPVLNSKVLDELKYYTYSYHHNQHIVTVTADHQLLFVS